MEETRQSARQRAACQAILVSAHCRVRANLWRRRRLWGRSRSQDITNLALLTLWNGMVQFPNQALMANYLRSDGRQFCQEAMREARMTLRFIVAGGVGLLTLGAAAFSLLLLGTLPTFSAMVLIGTALSLPIWLTFLGLEWIEYRTASYLAAAVDTAIKRLSLVSGSASDESA